MTPSDSPRRIMLAGGSNLIGRHLSAALLARCDEVLVLSRHPAAVQARLSGCAVLRWHPGSDGRWRDELDVVDAVVDVSGAPFFTKWRGDYYKREVLGSRRTAIQLLIKAIARASVRPKVFVSTSSLGPYGFRRDNESLTERSAPDIGPLSRDALELETGIPARPGDVKAKILVCHGAVDRHVPTRQVTDFGDEMNAVQVMHTAVPRVT